MFGATCAYRNAEMPPEFGDPRGITVAGREHEVVVLGGLSVVHGQRRVAMPPSAGRLAAYLAAVGDTTRVVVAESLWPEIGEPRALANLRSTLWRLQRCCPGLVEVSAQSLRLADGVEVDLPAAVELTFALIGGELDERSLRSIQHETWWPLTMDVLPEFDDDWVALARDRYRQLRLHALESLADALSRCGRHAEAIDVASAAMRADPLRETSHRALIMAHVGEGNQVEALRAYRRCAQVLANELGVRPTPALRAVLRR